MKVPMLQEEGHFQLFIFECRDNKNGNYMGTSQEDPKNRLPNRFVSKNGHNLKPLKSTFLEQQPSRNAGSPPSVCCRGSWI